MKGTFLKNINKKKLPVICICAAALLLILVLLIVWIIGSGRKAPVLAVETPQRLSASQSDTFTLDVTISDLGDTLYPAMSLSLSFDPSCLEFLGVEEGNLFVTDSKIGRKLPQWSCNPQKCNETGMINVMYLDLTGGTESFSKKLMADEDNVVLRLSFRLRGSARSGDVYHLRLEDAVFAASDEKLSLAMTKETLKAQNAKIVVGD